MLVLGTVGLGPDNDRQAGRRPGLGAARDEERRTTGEVEQLSRPPGSAAHAAGGQDGPIGQFACTEREGVERNVERAGNVSLRVFGRRPHVDDRVAGAPHFLRGRDVDTFRSHRVTVDLTGSGEMRGDDEVVEVVVVRGIERAGAGDQP